MINQVNNVDQEPTQKDPREKRIWQILFGILGITILFAIIVFFILPRENQEEPSVTPTPEITANNVEANLIHEAAIGKIAGEQITKLMTLGLTEKEAEEEIINGFLR